MILKKIKIMNYRQLQSVELDMQDSLTVLAGPNNSGKTTLISVLKGMFCDKKLGFSYSDIPISLSSMWLDKTVPVFQKIMLEYDKEKGVQKIIDEMTDNNKFSNDYTMDNFQAQIQVDYDPDNDNIQYFADYLMDLDDTKHSFYFIYTYEPSITAFEKGLNERYDRMAARVRDIANPGCIEKETKFYFLKEELLRIYCNAVIEKCYFCNSNYKNENLMEVAAFKSLFNFQNIPAMRELDDNESDSSKGISKRVIALLKDNDTWVEATKKLPDLLMADIEDSGAKKEIKNSSIKSLDDTIRDISKTSGGHIGKLQLEMDVKEQDVEEFIRRITRAKYDVEGLLLNEESQGLGFSNLIYLHMRLVEYAGQCNQAAASVSKENIDRNIRDLFSKNNIIQLPPDPITAIDLFIPTIALIGAWKEDNEFDRKMIEQISGMEYSEFEARRLRHFRYSLTTISRTISAIPRNTKIIS